MMMSCAAMPAHRIFESSPGPRSVMHYPLLRFETDISYSICILTASIR